MKESEFRSLMASVSTEPLLAQLHGIALEAHVHKSFVSNEGLEVTLEYLGHAGSGRVKGEAEEAGCTLKFTKGPLFGDGKDRLGKVDVRPGLYYRPSLKNFTTIDSFAVVPIADAGKWLPNYGACVQKGTEPSHFIMFFQVTRASKHGVNGTVLRRLREEISKAHGGDKAPLLPFALIFITLKNSTLGTAQTVKTSDKKDFAKQEEFQQFRARLTATAEARFQRLVSSAHESAEASAALIHFGDPNVQNTNDAHV